MTTIVKTTALALRIIPYSETSQIVTWLTASEGRLSTLVKGARRPKSWFLGQYDLFYTCELLYYARSRTQLHVARECAPLATRTALRADWRAAAAASYACDLLARVTVPGGEEAGLFRLAETTLDFMCRGAASPALLFWFELALLRAIGVAPQLARCARCSGALGALPTAYFSAASGGAVCAACAAQSTDIASVAAEVLEIMRRWQAAATPASSGAERCTRNQLFAVRSLLGVFLRRHLDLAVGNRSVALRLLNSPDAKKEGSES
jgi:DNA repair protein RecO (recombination protein O)